MITVTTPTGRIIRSTAGSNSFFQGLNAPASPRPLSPSRIDLPPAPVTTLGMSGTLSTRHSQDVPNVTRADTFSQHQPEQPITHAIDFVNRIKTRYADEPEVYRRFLDVLQGYQKDGKGIESVSYHHYYVNACSERV